jgi:hypothetical protein
MLRPESGGCHRARLRPLRFFRDRVFDLIDSMAVHGFSIGKGSHFGTALVGRDGTLHESGPGNHRFYVASLLGVSPFPIQVAGVDQDWLRMREGLRRKLDLSAW